MKEETFTDGPLTLRLFETPESVCLEWRGQSTAREPGKFLLPVLSKSLDIGLQRHFGETRLAADQAAPVY